MRLSLCMIVKNEGDTLRQTLLSAVGVADEFVIGVDDSSTDDTLDVAFDVVEENGLKADIYSFTWSNDFSEARNRGIERAKGDFILILDGHEVIERGHDKIREVMEDPKGYEVFQFEQRMRRGGYETSYFMPRLFRNHYRYHNACHNVIVFDPAVAATLPGVRIAHTRSESLEDQRKQQRMGMNIPGLLERVRSGDRRAKAQLPQEYLSKRDWPAAIAALEDYLTEEMQDRERYQVLIKLATACFWGGQTYRAEAALLEAARYNEDKRNAHLVFLGELYRGMGCVDTAEDVLEQAINVPKPTTYWFLYPKFYHETPTSILETLRKTRDQHIATSDSPTPTGSDG